jgi:hypothetical protein
MQCCSHVSQCPRIGPDAENDLEGQNAARHYMESAAVYCCETCQLFLCPLCIGEESDDIWVVDSADDGIVDVSGTDDLSHTRSSNPPNGPDATDISEWRDNVIPVMLDRVTISECHLKRRRKTARAVLETEELASVHSRQSNVDLECDGTQDSNTCIQGSKEILAYTVVLQTMREVCLVLGNFADSLRTSTPGSLDSQDMESAEVPLNVQLALKLVRTIFHSKNRVLLVGHLYRVLTGRYLYTII